MPNLSQLVSKASRSGWYLWLLNRVMSRAVPFNAPHHIRIISIRPGSTKVLLPYRRVNKNHVNGIHACALATLCEFTIGMSLITLISESRYRIILKNLNLEYHYQAKMDVIAEFELTNERLQAAIAGPLETADAVFEEFEINVYDTAENHICTGLANWQIKKWERVGTK
jgi:acyl-coenzyme A thioesterase PaaI-like protein